jgi:diaminopropionate ammonia-lyase
MNRVNKPDAKWVLNDFYSEAYNEKELKFFNKNRIEKVLEFQKTHRKYTKTPLVSLENLSKYLNVQEIRVKDESKRFGLNAFKVMGGIYAVGKYLAEKLGRDIDELSFDELQSPEIKEKLGDITFISATDGNHGRGIAWAAKELGQKSVIYLPKGSSKTRLEAVRQEGAYGEITDMNYDDTVRMCAELAEEKGWVMVQDTAWEGYDKIPLWIMQGYAAIAKEIVEELEAEEAEVPTHIILQAGVGSFAAGIAAYFENYYREQAPKIIIVEPEAADTYYRSFSKGTGEMVPVTGDMNSIMAGLNCGEPNVRAFRVLSQYAHASFSCTDRIAALGMRVLGNPPGTDERIISGESGAIPLGLLFHLRKFADAEAAKTLQLDEKARVLIINTEGDTDAEHYLDVVWKGYFQLVNTHGRTL